MIVAPSGQARERARENACARAHARACVCLRACVHARICECTSDARACSLLQGDSDVEASLLLTRAHRQCAERPCDLRGLEAEPRATCMCQHSRVGKVLTAPIGHGAPSHRPRESSSVLSETAHTSITASALLHRYNTCSNSNSAQPFERQNVREGLPTAQPAATAGSVRHCPFRLSQIPPVDAPLYQRVAAEHAEHRSTGS